MKKNQEIKQKYHTALIENLKRDVVLHNLKSKKNEYRYSEFSAEFCAVALAKLRAFGTSQKDDSTFVLTAVRSLYQNNFGALKDKTYSGISRNKNKQALSPEKLSCLKNVYGKRMEYVRQDLPFMNNERKSNFAKHVKTAIESINKINNK